MLGLKRRRSVSKQGIPAIFILETAGTIVAGSEYFPPPDSKGGWRSLTGASDAQLMEKAGIDRARLDQAFEFAKDTIKHGGLVVVRHGWLGYEKYFCRADPNAHPEHGPWGKAFTTLAIG